MSNLLKVGIIGCGKIADAHVAQVQRISGCEIVGACDAEPMMARQLCERFAVKQCFTSVDELIDVSKPDVVHITTPPTSHFELAKLCMERGCNVYVEKPFTVDVEQAEQLIQLAQRTGLKLTVGHNYQFSHAARRMRELVNGGYLGGAPLHMESYYGYDLGDPSYARALLSDKRHWVRRLPGKLLQNVISHGVARIAEFLVSSSPRVVAVGFPSPLLESIGENDIVDELRVMIFDECGRTAYFTFSSQIKPVLQEFRLYGASNGLILDQNHEVVVRLRGAKFKSYADFFIPPVQTAKQQLRECAGNVKLFLKHDFHMDSGMKFLIEAFYASIKTGGPPPISYRELLVTARIMDAIFTQTCGVLPKSEDHLKSQLV